MYVGSEDFVEQYENIKKRAISHTTCKLVIFVAAIDIDALCSTKILSQLLKSDLILHKIVPIVGFEDLLAAYKVVDQDPEINTVICIGCCATIDLLEFLQCEVDNLNKRFYILDNHRPWNLENLFGSDKVICFYDEDTGDTSKVEKIKNAYIKLLEYYEKQDMMDNDDDVGDQEIESEDDDIEEIISDSESDTRTQRRVRHAEKVKVARQLEREIERNERQLESYYLIGSYISTSISSQVYSLISDLGIKSNLFLWFTVVGSTALDSQHPHVYKYLYPALKSEVLRLNPRSVNPEFSATNNNNSISIQGPDGPQINSEDSLYPETDYLFFLLRHWSLYESMKHSSYISAKLRLYTEDGRKKMNKMLARMGISLHDANENWIHTNVAVKRTLKVKLAGVASLYGIEDVIREGIIRRFGFKGSVSAGDCVDALDTLLQIGNIIIDPTKAGQEGLTGRIFNERGDPSFSNSSGPISSTIRGNNGLSNENDEGDIFSGINNGNGTATVGATVEQQKEYGNAREEFWIKNFWIAWDALDNIDLLMAGVNKAKQIQQTVVVAANQLFEKRLIKNLSSYRLAVIQDGPDLELFSNPLALSRLALWISESCAEASPVPLPLIVASYYPPTDTYLVLGMGPRRLREENIDKRASDRRRIKKEKKKKQAQIKREKLKRRSAAHNDEDDGYDLTEEEEEEGNEDEDDDEEESKQEELDFLLFNKFGTQFRAVAQETNARVKLDAFDSSIMEVARSDLSRFLESLTLKSHEQFS